jgi:ADP-ribose pyrophosphatase
MLEFPAGKLDAGEPRWPARSASCSRRPATARANGRYAGGCTTRGLLDEGIEIWFARGLTAGSRRLDEGEFLETVQLMQVDELDRAGGAR